jgi:hypothetical protein
MKKRWLVIGVVFAIAIALIIFFTMKHSTGGVVNSGEPIRYVPLSQEEVDKVAQTIISSEFIKDVPEKNPIALIFFNFENGKRVQQDAFLIGNNQLLTQGTPSVYLTLHSRYISELNGNNLCDVIKEANKNGDLGFQSEYNTAILLIKYVGLLKYRNCFGF